MSEAREPQPDRGPDLGDWQHIFERSLNPMLITDDGRFVLDANAAACLLLRKRRDELRGLQVDDFTPSEAHPQLGQLFETLLSKGTQAGPFTLLCSDKLRLDVEYGATANIRPGHHLLVFFIWPILDRGGTQGSEVGPAYQAALEKPENPPLTLSTREREVLTLLALGDDGEQIARQLFIAPATVRTHIQNARLKLGASTRAHAIALALRDGEISIDLSSPIPSFVAPGRYEDG